MDTLNKSVVEILKESVQGKRGVDDNIIITYKTPYVANGQLVTVSLSLVEGVVCSTILSYPLL